MIFTESVQDYLKIIFQLCNEHNKATTSQIANKLHLKPASVTSMLQKMSRFDPPLVIYAKHYGVTLTPEGNKAALQIIRNHRVIETYLHEKLGYRWDEVHEEADRLEHAISAKLVERMADALGQPKRDPHGHIIPSVSLELPTISSIPLSDLTIAQIVTVKRIQEDKRPFPNKSM